VPAVGFSCAESGRRSVKDILSAGRKGGAVVTIVDFLGDDRATLRSALVSMGPLTSGTQSTAQTSIGKFTNDEDRFSEWNALNNHNAVTTLLKKSRYVYKHAVLW
jgi:hypothetical protein